MFKSINVEAENLELILENSHGDKVIIPANKRNWVKQKLSEGCHNCIDSLVETLPIASQYAQDGSVYPPNARVKVNHNNQIKEYDINSSDYRDLYNSGRLVSYDKTTNTYSATPLKEVTVTAEAPQWLKHKREYEKTNPKSDYINSYLTPFAKLLGNTKTNYPKRLDDEYEQKSLDYVSEQLVKNKPQGKLSRAEWLNQMSDKEEELIKRNPKYQSSLWADTKRGLTSLVEQNPLQAFQDILDSSDYTNREKQEMLKDYTDHPVMSKLGDATKILNPLTVPSKMIQSTYKDDYSFSDALEGKKNNAGIVEDIVTDPLNLVGVGLAGKLSKADKVIDATKAGSKVLNKLDDAVNNTNRIKFDDLKNDNEFFRVIVGDEAFDDIVQTQKIRTKRPSSVGKTGSSSINLDRRGATAFPSFSKGSPSLDYANNNPNHYIIKTSDKSIKPSTSGRHGKGTTMFPTDDTGKHLPELDASKVQVYKHVGNGEYELVNTAKPKSNFKSEIDWGKWNKEIPNNKSLMKEYEAIEKAAKASKTWMKNPDGSPFQGTPEQFVQQQSSWFKKAFPNVFRDEAGNVQKTYHGSQNTFDYFDPNIMMTGRTRGQGIYTSPFRERAASYATKGDKKVYEFYQNANKPQDIVQQFNKASEQRFEEFLEKNPKGSKDFDKKFDEFMKKEDELFNLTDDDFNLQKGYDFLKVSPDEYVVPFSNYPKSAIGNNGMFDMTNPNIYKGIIPPALLFYLQSQEQNKKEQ